MYQRHPPLLMLNFGAKSCVLYTGEYGTQYCLRLRNEHLQALRLGMPRTGHEARTW